MITQFKKYSMNESIKKYDTNNLKMYVRYVINQYSKVNPNWDESGIYFNLNQFLQEGKIKNLMNKNDKISMKIEIINLLKDKINKTFNVDIESFEDYYLKQNSPEEYIIKKDSNKYNL